MKCKKCGSPLPSEGVACKFCGVLMDQEQINYRNKMNNKNNDRVVLLSEKYGHQNNIEYRNNKENKLLGLVIISVILASLIILTVLVNL